MLSLPRTASAALLGLLAACALPAPSPVVRAAFAAGPAAPQVRRPYAPRLELERWPRDRALLQGWFGVAEFDEIQRGGGRAVSVDGTGHGLETMPSIGGGAQKKFAGGPLDVGLEGLLAFTGRADARAFTFGGSGAAVAVDVDLFLFDLYGGPFVSLFLGERARVYAGAGPLLQWADWEENDGTDPELRGSGWGLGWYARAGLEVLWDPRTWVGLGVQWSEAEADLGGELGDLELESLRFQFTMSRGL